MDDGHDADARRATFDEGAASDVSDEAEGRSGRSGLYDGEAESAHYFDAD